MTSKHIDLGVVVTGGQPCAYCGNEYLHTHSPEEVASAKNAASRAVPMNESDAILMSSVFASSDEEIVRSMADQASVLARDLGHAPHQRRLLELIAGLRRRAESALKPIDMVLLCPRCGDQHIDAPEPGSGWDNPPHRSHLCHSCNYVWRPADVPTNGVEALKTAGSNDCPTAPVRAPATLQRPEADDSEVWPIVNIDVDDAGNISNAKLYAPGLPAGNHDVFPIRVPYIDEHTEAWLAVCKELDTASAGFMSREGRNGTEATVATIRALAAAADALEQPPATGAWRVGEFISSALRPEHVLMLAAGEKQIAEYGAHRDFVRWVSGPPSEATSTIAGAETASERGQAVLDAAPKDAPS